MKNRKGFTLIELLAVIVILGLLMAIAIPSVTKYITESRKKTLVSTIGNYMSALSNDVNDLQYTFTETNTVYAVPIDCISLERGGTDPFGEWHQASKAYFAYVLVQYDDETSSYKYGYTFKDSAGYGLYPTASHKLNERGKQIQTGLNLKKPSTGLITNLTLLENWKSSGFIINSNTNLVVLDSTSEGDIGDGVYTCTLAQKGTNYEQVEKEKEKANRLVDLVKKHNTIISSQPTLTDSSNNTGDASGLYKSTATTNENATFYFRGNVANNNVDFAGLKWKIIRINEDGTVRLILDGRINDATYKFNTEYNDYSYMYYSNSDTIKPTVDSWYKTNITDKGYDTYVATGIFCEQAKVKYRLNYTGESATMEYYKNYTPNFDCDSDGNGKGIVKNEDGTSVKVGLITYDEVIHAGGFVGKSNSSYYLYNGSYGIWTMSPAGFYSPNTRVWRVLNSGSVSEHIVNYANGLRPVINLKSDVLATGNGEKDTPYVIKTN